MPTPLDHPWINDSEFAPEYRDSIRVAMKSAEAMLESESPPAWILYLDQCAMWYRARVRIVISEYATMDIEGNPVDTPVSTLLSDEQTVQLLSELKSLKPDTLTDVESFVLDATWCVLSVINGSDGWCAFSEFAWSGTGQNDRARPGPKIAEQLHSLCSEFIKTSRGE